LYAVTSQAQQNTNGSPFSEPVMVYNNIKNGYWIFAGASVYKDSIIVPLRGNIYPMKWLYFYQKILGLFYIIIIFFYICKNIFFKTKTNVYKWL